MNICLTGLFIFVTGLIDQPVDSGVYDTIAPTMIGTTPSFHLYVGDKSEGVIRHFNEKGDLLAIIGGKGQGPGEIGVLLTGVQFFKNRLFAFDMLQRKIEVYSGEGTYLKTLRVPHQALSILSPAKRIPTGWVFADHRDVYMVDANFHFKRSLLHDISQQDYQERFEARILKPSETVNPAEDRPKFVVDHQIRYLYVTRPGEVFRIDVYDLQSSTRVRSIIRDDPPVRFDQEWGEKRYEEVMARSRWGQKMREPEYPKFFPHVMFLRMDYRGNLMIKRWRREGHLTLSPIGNEVETVDTSANRKVIARQGETLFIKELGENEHVLIHKIALADYERQVAVSRDQ